MAKTGYRSPRQKWKRVNWITGFQDVPLEWTVVDSNNGRVKTVRAYSQTDAVKEAVRIGVYPRKSRHVHPRQGGTTVRLMSEDEFQDLISKITG